jgi:hypothetical protein
MSDHRHTLRIGRPVRADTRRTVRVLREQVGGAPVTRSQKKAPPAVAVAEPAVAAALVVPTTSTGLYHIPASRAEAWKKELGEHPALAKYANIITRENWGPLTSEQKLMTYIELIERQDELFLKAVSIIYKQLDIDPNSDDLETKVFGALSRIPSSTQSTYRQYISDVYYLVTCSKPDLNIEIEKYDKYNKQPFILKMEPLAHILLLPYRVTNMLISSIAKIFISLKDNPALLTTASNGTTEIQGMFALVYNTFIQQEALNATSINLRDGFYLWQKSMVGVVPLDECVNKKPTQCEDNYRDKILLWQNFCHYYRDSKQLPHSLNTGFSHILADIFNIYKNAGKDKTIRDIYMEKFKPIAETEAQISSFRPNIVSELDTPESNMMRMLDPKQYTFIFHLLYTLEKLDKSKVGSSD